MKRRAWAVLERVHTRLFGHPPGEKTRQFLQDIIAVYGGTLIAGGFGLIGFLLTARLLGPEEYGKFNLIIATAGFLIIPMIWGHTTAAAKYMPAAKKPDQIIASVTTLVLGSILIFGALAYALAPSIAAIIGFDAALIRMATLYAAILAAYYLAEALLRGLMRMDIVGIGRAVLSIASLAVTLALLFSAGNHRASTPIIAGILGNAVFVCLALPWIRLRINSMTWESLRRILHYGLFTAISFITGTVMAYTDRVMLNAFRGVTEVGIFGAYQLPTLFVSEKLLAPFILVFFSTAAAYRHKRALCKKMTIVLPLAAAAIFALTAISVTAGFAFLGAAYPFSLLTAMVFCATAATYFAASARMWFIASTGIAGVRWSCLAGIIGMAVNIGGNYLLIPLLGVLGAALSTFGAAAALIAISIPALRRTIGGED